MCFLKNKKNIKMTQEITGNYARLQRYHIVHTYFKKFEIIQ